MLKRLILTGSTLRSRSPENKAQIAGELGKQVWPLIEEGKIKPVIHTTFPLTDAAEGHRLMESATHVGKIILVV